MDLYSEEQIQLLKDLNSAVAELKTILSIKPEVVIEKPKEIHGAVEVTNQVDTVNIKNIEVLTKHLDNLGELLTNTIINNAYKPLESVTVKNPVSDISINNFKELKKEFDELRKVIVNSQAIVNVEKQDVVFPNTARNYVSVRLTDGKAFYKAVANLNASMASLPDAVSELTGEKVLAVANADGTAIGSSGAAATDFLYDKGATYTYFGYSTTLAGNEASAIWRIKRMINATKEIRYADGISTYTKIWNDRASYTY